MSDEAVTDDNAGSETTARPEVNQQRRYFLIGATSAVAAVGVVGAAVPFVKSWLPSARARAAGAPVTLDFSKLRPGEILGPIPAWRGMPIFVVMRDQVVLARLEQENADLADPESDNADMQPDYAVNPWRSKRAEIGIYVGLCTHLGCSPKYYGAVQPELFDPNWQGGFFCPCHGSKFDLAGRVVKGVPAPDNLEVPQYRFESETVVVIGETEGIA
ncbi:MAG: ubiquinol-cytochrome c reductase iron-sulfur subunit [Gammaproteobacteria bacterium]|nr:ubiquinol-cytochrome c reductase iron-sulfur subunit [Gammaproteobacteria bacterium]